jgi:hypothetical protein
MTSLQVVALPRTAEQVLAIVAGASGATERCLEPDVRAWMATPAQGLAAAIELASGPEAVAAALARLAPAGLAPASPAPASPAPANPAPANPARSGLAPASLEVVGAVSSDDASWAEVARRGDGEAETCIVGLTYGPAGRVSRLVFLRAPLVPAGDVDAADAVRDARPMLERYFADLQSSRFRAAADHFSANAVYSHPPYAGGNERVLFRGRDALARGFETDRGPSPARQIITDLWQQGSRAFVEGIIEGIPNGGSFFSTAEISRQGEIARYVAFYSATRIPGA